MQCISKKRPRLVYVPYMGMILCCVVYIFYSIKIRAKRTWQCVKPGLLFGGTTDIEHYTRENSFTVFPR